jgi:hypothetical protein
MFRTLLVMFMALSLAGSLDAQTPGQSKDYMGMKIVNLNVTQQWTPTGVNCKNGDTLYIYVRGVLSSTTNDPSAWVSPDGNGYAATSQFPVPSASQMSVIGKVGGSGSPFPVGSQRYYVSSSTGELNLGINDIVNFADNGGTLIATILKQQNHIVSVVSRNTSNPTELNLNQNYPNPFNPSTTIEYEIPIKSAVDISIYNSAGQLMRSLQSDQQEAGKHSIQWDGKDNNGTVVSTGSYFCQMRAGGLVETRKMILLK